MSEKNGEINQFEKQEIPKEYSPITVLREREFYPGVISIDENGQDKIEDEDLSYIFKFLRKNVKKGSLLNIGAGITHCHQMVGLADKLTQITALDISPKNNQLIQEFLDRIKGIGGQTMVEDGDMKTLKTLAEALAQDKQDFGIEKTGDELLDLFYKESFYNGQPDIITADMVEDMDKLGSGELVDGRKYDNIMFSFALYVRDKNDLVKLFGNLKKRLNPDGHILIIDAKTFSIDEENEGEVLYSEDAVVLEKYSEAYDWTIDDIKEIAQKVGFGKVEAHDYKIQDKKEEQEKFGGYLFLKIEE